MDDTINWARSGGSDIIFWTAICASQTVVAMYSVHLSHSSRCTPEVLQSADCLRTQKSLQIYNQEILMSVIKACLWYLHNSDVNQSHSLILKKVLGPGQQLARLWTTLQYQRQSFKGDIVQFFFFFFIIIRWDNVWKKFVLYFSIKWNFLFFVPVYLYNSSYRIIDTVCFRWWCKYIGIFTGHS